MLGKVRARIAEKAADQAARARVAAALAAVVPGARVHTDDQHDRTTVQWFSEGEPDSGQDLGYGVIGLDGDATTASFKVHSLPIRAVARLAGALAGQATAAATLRRADVLARLQAAHVLAGHEVEDVRDCPACRAAYGLKGPLDPRVAGMPMSYWVGRDDAAVAADTDLQVEGLLERRHFSVPDGPGGQGEPWPR